jgi:virginiamycin B lyase
MWLPVLCAGMLIAAKWSVAVLLTMAGSIALQNPESKPTPAPAATPILLALTRLVPEATIAIGGERQIAVTPDGVWISNRAAGTITRIDPRTNELGSPLAVGKEPCFSVLSAFKDLWVPLCGGPGLARITTDKPKSDAASAAVDKAPKLPIMITLGIRSAGPIVTGASSVWMITDNAGTLSRIDPDTNAVVAEVTVPAGPAAIAFGEGAVWMTSSSTDKLTRVNGDTNVVTEHIKVGKGPSAVAVGEGAVWTLNSGDGTVSRVDPKTNKVTMTIKTGVTGTSGSMAIGEGSVWLSAPGMPLTRIDPATNRMVQQFSGPGGGALAIGFKSLWISATPAVVWRVDPRRIEATRR